MGQELGVTHWMASAQSPCEVLVKMSAGLQASEGLGGEGGTAFMVAHGRQEPRFFTTWVSPQVA